MGRVCHQKRQYEILACDAWLIVVIFFIVALGDTSTASISSFSFSFPPARGTLEPVFTRLLVIFRIMAVGESSRGVATPVEAYNRIVVVVALHIATFIVKQGLTTKGN